MIPDKRFFFCYPRTRGEAGATTFISEIEVSPKIIENWECHYNLFTSPSAATLTLKAGVPGLEVEGVSVEPGVIQPLPEEMKPRLFHRKIIHTIVDDVDEWRIQPYFLDTQKWLHPILPFLELEAFHRIPSHIPIPDDIKPYLKSLPIGAGDERAYYLPTWKGYVDNVTTNFSNGIYTHVIALQDIFMWYNLSRVNIRPSMAAGWIKEFFWARDEGVEAYFPTILSRRSLSEILRATLGFRGAGGESDPLLVGAHEFLLDIAEQTASWFTVNESQWFRAVRDQFTTSGVRGNWFIQGDLVWSRNLLRIDNEIVNGSFGNIIPYKFAKGTEDIWQHNFKTRLEILNELREALSLEIFMDTTTELIVKLPSYNEPISLLPDREPVLDFALRDLTKAKVISQNISEIPGEAVNFLTFTGEPFSTKEFTVESEVFGQCNRVNANSIRRYLVRAESASSSLTIDKESIKAYSKFLMEKMNTDVFQGSTTIVSQPGVRLGRNVLFKFGHLTMIGYVVSLDESWQPNAQPQLTLGLQAIRDSQSSQLYSAFPYSDFTKSYSVRRYPVASGGMLQNILPLFYTKSTNKSVQESVVESNRDNFKTKYKLLSISEVLAKDIRDLFKEGISSVVLKGADK